MSLGQVRGLMAAHLEQDRAEDRRFMTSVRAAVWADDRKFGEIMDREAPDTAADDDESDDLLAASLAAWGYRLETDT
jgi:hypothetical protein